MRAAVLLVLVAGLAGCGRGPAPATGPVAAEGSSEDRGPPAGYRGPVGSYLREARSAAYVLDRSPPPPLLTAEDVARRVNDMYTRLPPAPAEWDRKTDMDVLLKRINEEVSLGATWVAKVEKAEETEAKKYRESLREPQGGREGDQRSRRPGRRHPQAQEVRPPLAAADPELG